jgi:3-hydroxy-9,10-secoandrosta-1,3,5(10)-triene-9,17-dione monooxygenase reductase component
MSLDPATHLLAHRQRSEAAERTLARRPEPRVRHRRRGPYTAISPLPVRRSEQEQFRTLMGTVAMPVVIVTGQDEGGEPLGFTVSSFSSVSLSPPLVSFCVQIASVTWSRMAPQEGFAINMLGAGQRALADRFAGPGDRFRGVAHARTRDGLPILSDTLASVVCRIEDGMRAGDHDIIIGRVLRACQGPVGTPLAHHAGTYACAQPLDVSDVVRVS